MPDHLPENAPSLTDASAPSSLHVRTSLRLVPWRRAIDVTHRADAPDLNLTLPCVCRMQFADKTTLGQSAVMGLL